MGSKDPRVDAYIRKSAEFARPVLSHLRALVHEGCPEVEETIKWGMPTFMYRGILCGMSAFNAHCAFHFWKGSGVVDQGDRKDDAMGQFGRITQVSDLPSRKVLTGYVKAAVRLKDAAVKAPRAAPRARKPPLPVPDDLAKALRKSATGSTSTAERPLSVSGRAGPAR